MLGHDLSTAQHSPLGLTAKEREIARLRASYAAYVAMQHRAHITYTEDDRRWSGINRQANPWSDPPTYPLFADCSAFVTWCLWRATRNWHLKDFVNGEYWAQGYTGTMTEHGAAVDLAHLLHADAIFYGGTHDIPQHVAIYVGNGKVISHGQQGDPQVYPVNLDNALPIVGARRYIR